MLLNQKMRTLAVITFFACIAVTLAKRESICCRQVSVKRITDEILGFKVHQAKPPCVKAVIFYTAKDAVCSHWRENWVQQKVIELRRFQAIETYRKMNATTVTGQITGTTAPQL